MTLFELKAILSVPVLICGIAGVLVPWGMSRRNSGQRLLVWGDTFAGGVLLAAGIVHLLSRAAEDLHSLAPGLKYPLAFTLSGAGFLLILLIEAVILADTDPGRAPLHPSSEATHRIGPRRKPLHTNPVTLILFLVLSIHSIVVGMALGAQNSSSEAWILFIAIVAHKSMAGFALGVGYRRAGCSLRRAIPVAVAFSVMAPAGMLAGAAIKALISVHGTVLFEAIFDSAGAGTFLYIATLDILRTEFEKPGDRWQKWSLAFAGFGIMAILAMWL